MSEAIPNHRRILLRVMLTSLALAAAAGVLGVLVPGKEVVWRLVVTALMTAIGCGLIFAAARGIEKSETRPGAIAGLIFVLIEYLLTLLLIWDIPRSLFAARSGDESLGLTMLFFAAVGVPAIGMVRMMSTPVSKIAGITGATLLAFSFLTMMVGLWLTQGRNGDGHIVGAGFCAEAFAFPIAACLVGWMPDTRRPWRWIGVCAALFAGAIFIGGILSHADENKMMLHLAVWASVVAFIIAHANVSLHAALPRGITWLRPTTIVAVIAAGIFIGLQIQYESSDEMLSRVSAAAGICAACGSVAMAIVTRMNKKAERERIAPTDITQINVICPGCQSKQLIPLGESSCAECGLRFEIKIEEPRCENCGYLLYRLKSDRCPECGTPIGTRTAPVRSA